jgi:hypothetical protein
MKTKQTLTLEHDISVATRKMGVFGAFEVTIGWFGRERVDYLTYDTNGIFRAYEIKSSISDFRSHAVLSFVGDYNYYVLTPELYERVKDLVPKHIGVYVGCILEKKARRQSLSREKRDILKDSLIRCLCRDRDKSSTEAYDSVCRERNNFRRDYRNERGKYWSLVDRLREIYGERWDRELRIMEALKMKGHIS